MVNRKVFSENLIYNESIAGDTDLSNTNPLNLKVNLAGLNIESNYSQVVPVPAFDKDSIEILNSVEDLNNISPYRLFLPYSYKLDEINGERFYDDNGTLELIVEYENELIREYYPANDNIYVKTILEKSKNELLSKIELSFLPEGDIKINIIIFDSKINQKYTMFHIEEHDKIISITEFFEQSKNFRTLFRNRITSLPERYVESKENRNGELELIDCKLNPTVQEIRRTIQDREIIIRYEDDKKFIDVRRKILD